jgi:porphobilinogen synthase
MPGVMQHTIDSLRAEAHAVADLGIGGIILFGIPDSKDAAGSGADGQEGIVQRALAKVRADLGESVALVADLCLDEYTDHGHCGILDADGLVDNDATIARYRSIAVSQAEAGADIVAPSGMMDGQVAAIRDALDDAGRTDVAIMSYAAKFASAFYEPFRDAAECAPQFGDRSAYQLDPANVREAVREIQTDEAEGADIVMVKPALAYLDVVRAARAATALPLAAYSVSGEYAMVKAAGAAGWINERAAMLEILTGIVRAGADVIVTYFAQDAALALR